MARRAPPYARFRFAREGTIGAGGKLPADWSLEQFDDLTVDEVDLGPDGPAIGFRLTFSGEGASGYASLVLGGYQRFARDDIAVLRLETRFSDISNIAGAFLIVREWIAGGKFVGQAARPLALSDELAAAVAARAVSGPGRVLQPVLSFKRSEPGPAQITVRVARVAFASLYDHPQWLAGPSAARSDAS